MTLRDLSSRSVSTTALVVAVGVLFVAVIVVRSLAASDWDPTVYTAFGEESIPTREYAEERLGEVFLREQLGHDGRFFFVQAHDPFVLAPETNASVLDRPLYRSQRMLYPLLTGGFGLFDSETIVWSMIVVNVLAMGAGTWATAAVAKKMGLSAWWGLAFTINPGFISEVNISGAGVVAAAAAFGALVFILSGRPWVGVVLLTLAALSREAMLIAALGTAWWLWRYSGEKRNAVLSALVPVSAVALWAGYLRLQIGVGAGAIQVQELGLPFGGLLDALATWSRDPLNLVVGVTLLGVCVFQALRTLRSSHLVGWAFIGFGVLLVLFTRQVWVNYFDISRAVAPVLTSYVLMIFAAAPSGLDAHDRRPVEPG